MGWEVIQAMFACKCGSRRFYAHQVCQLDVICDEGGTFVANAKEGDTSASIYEADNPYGPFTCVECGRQYSELSHLSERLAR